MKKLLVPIFFILSMIFPAYASAQTRVLGDFEIGSDAGLGFKEPHIAAGATVESRFKRFEVHPFFKFSPDIKYFALSGYNINVGSRQMFWVNKHLAMTGMYDYSAYWQTYQIPTSGVIYPNSPKAVLHKTTNFISPGFLLQKDISGVTNRWYLDYIIPTGCVWATETNPCQIQSNRTTGVKFVWTARLYSRLEFGLTGGVYHLADQSNPHRPDLPRTTHVTGDMSVLLRFILAGK